VSGKFQELFSFRSPEEWARIIELRVLALQLIMPEESIHEEQEFPESVVDEMLDDDYGPDNSDEDE